jgi:hypothetical protein
LFTTTGLSGYGISEYDIYGISDASDVVIPICSKNVASWMFN